MSLFTDYTTHCRDISADMDLLNHLEGIYLNELRHSETPHEHTGALKGLQYVLNQRHKLRKESLAAAKHYPAAEEPAETESAAKLSTEQDGGAQPTAKPATAKTAAPDESNVSSNPDQPDPTGNTKHHSAESAAKATDGPPRKEPLRLGVKPRQTKAPPR